MAQASSHIRSSTSKYTWSAIIFIVILFILSPFSPPKAAMASKPTNTVPIETIAVEHKQTRTMPSLDTVNELLRTHPHPDVRGEFYEMIRDGKINTFWTQGASAAFGLIPANLLGHSEAISTTEPSPVLLVNPKILPPANRASAQLTLYHEFVHYEQWRNKRMPIDTFTPKKIGLGKNAQEACTKKWYAEVEAYHQECAYAQESNLLTQIDPRSALYRLCTSLQGTFDDLLRMTLVHSETLGTACATTWASL